MGVSPLAELGLRVRGCAEISERADEVSANKGSTKLASCSRKILNEVCSIDGGHIK